MSDKLNRLNVLCGEQNTLHRQKLYIDNQLKLINAEIDEIETEMQRENREQQERDKAERDARMKAAGCEACG